jgi:hypothetical protein
MNEKAVMCGYCGRTFKKNKAGGKSVEERIAAGRALCAVCSGVTMKNKVTCVITGNMIDIKGAKPWDEGGYITASKAAAYKKTCGVTKKVFYSNRAAQAVIGGKRWYVSVAGRKILTRRGMFICRTCLSATQEEGSAFGMYRRALSGLKDGVLNFLRGDIRDLMCCNNCIDIGRSIVPYYEGVKSYTAGGCRTIGVELECQPSAATMASMLLWAKDGVPLVSAKQDTSLRGPNQCEYTSPIIDEITMDEWLAGFFDRLNAQTYSRCGLHIHIGSKGIPSVGIFRLMKWCKENEADIVSLVSPSRIPTAATDGSGRPLILPPQWVTANVKNRGDVMRLLYGFSRWNRDNGVNPILANRRANDQHGPRYNGTVHRYQWLNVHSHFHRGTIEIRLHQATTSHKKLRNWILLWLKIIDDVTSGRTGTVWDLMPAHLLPYFRHRVAALDRILPNRQAIIKKAVSAIPTYITTPRAQRVPRPIDGVEIPRMINLADPPRPNRARMVEHPFPIEEEAANQ